MAETKIKNDTPTNQLPNAVLTTPSLDAIDRSLLAMNFYEVESGNKLPSESLRDYRENRDFLLKAYADPELRRDIQQRLYSLFDRGILSSDALSDLKDLLKTASNFRLEPPDEFSYAAVLTSRRLEVSEGSFGRGFTTRKMVLHLTHRDILDDLRAFLDDPKTSLPLVGKDASAILDHYLAARTPFMSEKWGVSSEQLHDVLKDINIQEVGSIIERLRHSTPLTADDVANNIQAVRVSSVKKV